MEYGQEGKRRQYFFPTLVVEQGFFFSFFFCPGHHGSLVTGELCQKIIVFPKFFVDAGRSFAVIFAVGLFDIDILIAFISSKKNKP